jgi:hypothetical protein
VDDVDDLGSRCAGPAPAAVAEDFEWARHAVDRNAWPLAPADAFSRTVGGLAARRAAIALPSRTGFRVKRGTATGAACSIAGGALSFSFLGCICVAHDLLLWQEGDPRNRNSRPCGAAVARYGAAVSSL